MIRLEDLALFVRAAALGGFSDVAREVDLLPGQVSAAIKRLERELDVRLFARSTRSMRLTAEGERYLPFAQEALASLGEGQQRLRSEEANCAAFYRSPCLPTWGVTPCSHGSPLSVGNTRI